MTVYTIFAEDSTVVGGTQFVGAVSNETSAQFIVAELNVINVNTTVNYRYEESQVHDNAGAFMQVLNLL